MTHDELRWLVRDYIPALYQNAMLDVIDEHRRLREMSPAPQRVTPLTPEQLDVELPGYLANEGRA